VEVVEEVVEENDPHLADRGGDCAMSGSDILDFPSATMTMNS